MNVLWNYPNEILAQIFSYLSSDDVQRFRDEPLLYEYYLNQRYRLIHVDYDSYWELHADSTSRSINPSFLQTFLDLNPLLKPKDIYFECPSLLEDVPEETLDKFKRVFVNELYGRKDVRITSKSSNPRCLSLSAGFREEYYHILTKIPQHTTILSLQEFSIEAPLSSNIIELELKSCKIPNLSVLPETLQRLRLLELKLLNWSVHFPKDLVDLEVKDVHVKERVDISYLVKLKKFKTDDMFKMFYLPNSITSLECTLTPDDQPTDLTNLQSLFKLKIVKSTDFDFYLPLSLTEVEYELCYIVDLTQLQILPRLNRLSFTNCGTESPEQIDVRYAASLKLLQFHGHFFASASQAEATIVKFSHLPKNLESFEFQAQYFATSGPDEQTLTRTSKDQGRFLYSQDQNQNVMLDSNMIWPSSLKKIQIRGVVGFFNLIRTFKPEEHELIEDFDGESSSLSVFKMSKNRSLLKYTYLQGHVWPPGLQSLSLLDFERKLFLNTNLAEIENLKFLNLGRDGAVVVKDNIPAWTDVKETLFMHRRIVRNNYSPHLREIHLTGVKIKLNNQWVSSFRNLNKLSIIESSMKVSEAVTMPSKFKHLDFSECKLTNSDWKHIACPRGIESIRLFKNKLDQFDFSILNKNTKSIFLHDNKVPLTALPHWDEVCREEPKFKQRGWMLWEYRWVDDIGECYHLANTKSLLHVAIIRVAEDVDYL